MTKSSYAISIGTLAKTCNVPAPTIRYYEKIELLPEAKRSRSDQRRYDRADVERLHFIRRCRAFGFSTKQVRSLLAVPTGSVADCQISKEIAVNRIKEIRSKVSDLLALEKELEAVIDQCQTTCGDQSDKTCCAFTQMQSPPQLGNST
jgi:DNA-binding transcriptional MerR regulator